MCKTLNIEPLQLTKNTFTKNNVQPHMSARYAQYWFNKVKTESKMRTYITIKNNFVLEDYLNIPDFNIRKHMTKLRISAHRLEIEKGRYSRPKIPANHRICTHCDCNEVEDELHLLMKCPLYSKERTPFLSCIKSKVKNFKALNDINKFIYLLSAGEDIAIHTAKFIKTCFSIRDDKCT
jgi:hypothetical protein